MTLDQEEFNSVVKRVHEMLLVRAEKANDRKKTRPTPRSISKHVEAAKDVYVFIHMMELIEHMSHEISDLREMLSAIGDVEDEDTRMSDIFSAKKKNYIN